MRLLETCAVTETSAGAVRPAPGGRCAAGLEVGRRG